LINQVYSNQLIIFWGNTITLKALQMVLDQIDGRPKQSIGFELGDIKPLETLRLTQEKVRINDWDIFYYLYENYQ